jgi:DNA repair photolyase
MKTLGTGGEEMDKKAVHGTGEWAAGNVNIQLGCEHDCKYCYAKQNAIRFKRATVDSWREPTLSEKAVNKCFGRRRGVLMVPSTHDVTAGNVEHYVKLLKRILEAGNRVLVVSKPHLECVKKMCEELKDYREQILYRFTIGSADDDVLGYWEPGAPLFEERYRSLKWAYDKGFETSVSCEPMLDGNIEAVIEKVRPYVTDAIWLGRANRLRSVLAINCPGDDEARRRADALIKTWNDTAVRDLYERFKNDQKIKWKDSIKKLVGIDRPTEKGMDV